MVTLDIDSPKNCEKCFFRINSTRYSWRCILARTDRNTARYIPYSIPAETKRASFCPLDKLEVKK